MAELITKEFAAANPGLNTGSGNRSGGGNRPGGNRRNNDRAPREPQGPSTVTIKTASTGAGNFTIIDPQTKLGGGYNQAEKDDLFYAIYP